ncbi:MAG: YceI family protein [Xanthomonadales bacterium]|nr:YceI family protein [Xanthomonadales bacterium]
MKALTPMACCALSLSAPGLLFADSGQWSSVAADSELGFAAYYEGEELPGRFAAFGVKLETDEGFPTASFESRDIRPAESGFLAIGRLRLKGIERTLEIPLAWRQEGGSATLSGSVTLSRHAWDVGTGEWSDNASLSDRVDVRWRVTLSPAD